MTFTTKIREMRIKWHIARMPVYKDMKADGMMHEITLPGPGLNVIAGIGEPALPILVRLLETGDNKTRAYAAMAIGEIMKANVTALSNGKETKLIVNPGKIKNPAAIAALCKALEDKYFHARKNAAEALGKIVDPQANSSLVSALKREVDVPGPESMCTVNSFHLAHALMSIARLYALPIDELSEMLVDQSSSVTCRYHCAQILGKYGDKRCIQPLIAALDDPDLGVVHNAAYELGISLEEESAAPQLLAALQKWGPDKQIGDALVNIGRGDDAINQLIDSMKPEDRDSLMEFIQYMRGKMEQLQKEGKFPQPPQRIYVDVDGLGLRRAGADTQAMHLMQRRPAIIRPQDTGTRSDGPMRQKP